MNDLETAWGAAWRDLRLPPPADDTLASLLAHWAQPHRRYHTLQHLRECLALFDAHRAQARHPGEVALAVWFHDAVYDTSRHDNEAASADWAVRVLAQTGAAADVAERVRAMIMATRHSHMPATADERLLVDIDLAILGAARERFDEYERQVRAEYIHVPDAQFRPRRRGLLQRFLERDALYATPRMRALLEQPARANLARSIASIG